ncbi:MAG TPA: hypothetical protein GX014_03020 [Firmicutes bacterium]|jgi:adenylate kinase|nr:hypothetical protein [Bacillota bacterium]HHT42352.1 hypothetical protein [Bacillota bacterium]
MQQDPLIVVVGVCASGKTTLGAGLRGLGYQVRTFAQEHSVSKHLWQRLDPDFLILLECSYETIRRRKRVSWGVKRYRKQLALLSNARAHADLIVRTDGFSAEQLVEYVHRHLVELGMGRLSNGG